jgi:8-oxo-dGTP pyrophosphatase MutT (NUDIX family)
MKHLPNLVGSGRLEPPPSDQFSLVLLKREGWFGTAYFLERREKREGYAYAGRIGLYGGHCNPDETRRDAAIREIREEMGLQSGATTIVSLLRMNGDNDHQAATEGEIFTHAWESKWGSPSVSALKRGLLVHRNSLNGHPHQPGRPVVLRRWFNLFFLPFGWTKLTPQAAYAIIADIDREHAQHERDRAIGKPRLRQTAAASTGRPSTSWA